MVRTTCRLRQKRRSGTSRGTPASGCEPRRGEAWRRSGLPPARGAAGCPDPGSRASWAAASRLPPAWSRPLSRRMPPTCRLRRLASAGPGSWVLARVRSRPEGRGHESYCGGPRAGSRRRPGTAQYGGGSPWPGRTGRGSVQPGTLRRSTGPQVSGPPSAHAGRIARSVLQLQSSAMQPSAVSISGHVRRCLPKRSLTLIPAGRTGIGRSVRRAQRDSARASARLDALNSRIRARRYELPRTAGMRQNGYAWPPDDCNQALVTSRRFRPGVRRCTRGPLHMQRLILVL